MPPGFAAHAPQKKQNKRTALLPRDTSQLCLPANAGVNGLRPRGLDNSVNIRAFLRE